MNKIKTVVAPREIKDQIERASRVLGCEASVAEHLGEDISFCEIYYGEGISTWLKLASSETNSFTDLLKISFRLESLCDSSSSEVRWETPIPFALIARSLHNYEKYPINWSCEPEAVSGNSQINCVYLKPNEPARVLSNEKVEEALSSGVEVSSIHWDELDGIASEFLLSEEILDAP